ALALTPTILRVADLEVDLGARRVRRAGRSIDLTAKEFALLELLLRHRDQVVDRSAITAHVWDNNHDPFANVLEVLVRRLRSKIDDGFERKLIRTVRGAADAVEELHIPDRELYLFDATGRPITPPQADAWIVDAARAAATSGSADVQHVTGGSHERRLHAERFSGRSGTTYVAAAVADRPNIREQYAALIGIFGAAALAALLLVAAGGFMLARKSTIPVERSMEQMRRFMADAAHELRTPVTILRTRTELALAQPRDATGDTAAFQAIEREADRLGGIVGDLLTLARADAGERQVVRASLYL